MPYRRTEPVDLLVLAFSSHDLRPGRQTAAYLSHVTPGAPMAFAICDQGSAAAFSGLRIAREYASSAGIRRALLIVVEQADLPYDCPVPLPSQHRGVAMLFGDGRSGDGRSGDGPADGGTGPQARLAGLRQRPGVPPDGAADLAAADLAELAAGHSQAGLVLSDALAAVWAAPAAARVRVMPPGQPSTGVWWELIDELTGDACGPDLVVAADYDPGLRYLCLAGFDTAAEQRERERILYGMGEGLRGEGGSGERREWGVSWGGRDLGGGGSRRASTTVGSSMNERRWGESEHVQSNG